jgi:hypothetical protein
LEDEEINKIAYKLKHDPNKNVNSYFVNIEVKQIDFPNDMEVQSNHNFTNKMEVLNEEFGIVRNLPLNSKIKVTSSPIKKNIVAIEELSSLSETETETISLNNGKEEPINNSDTLNVANSDGVELSNNNIDNDSGANNVENNTSNENETEKANEEEK